jgi:hypothetical protein
MVLLYLLLLVALLPVWGAPPSLSLPPSLVIMGVPMRLDTSSYFGDLGQGALVYNLVGNPRGSGLIMNADTGVISGTPNDVDIFAYSPMRLIVSAKNVDGERAQEGLNLTVVVASSQVGQEMTLDLSSVFLKVAVQTSGSQEGWTYALENLDLGLAIDSDTGVVKGTPTRAAGEAEQPLQILVVGSNPTAGDLYFHFNLLVSPEDVQDTLPVMVTGPPAYLGQTYTFELVGPLFDIDWGAFELDNPDLGSGYQVDAETGTSTFNYARATPISSASLMNMYLQACSVACRP